MKLVSCILLALVALSSSEEVEKESKQQEKRGIFDLGYGDDYGYGYSGHLGGRAVGEHVQTITLTKKIPYAVAQPYPVTVERKVPYAVPHPVPYTVGKPYPVTIPKPYPVPVEKPYPVTVEKPVPYPVHVPVKVPVAQLYPVPVPKPYAVAVPKPVAVPVPHPVTINKAVPVFFHGGHHGYDYSGSSIGHGYDNYNNVAITGNHGLSYGYAGHY